MQEVPQGYPKHHWIAVGHLGEAADEAVKEFPKLAAEIRKHRIKYMADPTYSVPILDLIEKASNHVKHEAKMTKKGQGFVSDEISHLMKDGPSKGPQKDKKMPQKQAVAVALDVARRKGFKSAPNPNEQVSIFDSIVQEMEFPGQASPSVDERQREREDRQRRMAHKRKLKVRRGTSSKTAKFGNRWAYRPKTKSIRGQPKKRQRWGETDPIHHEVARAGAEIGPDLAHGRNALARRFQRGAPPENTHVTSAIANRYPVLKDREDNTMSIFDSITERELPEAFKKNWGRFSSKAKKPEDDDGEQEEEEDEREEKDDDDDNEVEESSIFDAIVRHESNGSLFDGIVKDSTRPSKSVFDGIVESKNTAATGANWDDRVARTMALAEELVGIRNLAKKSK